MPDRTPSCSGMRPWIALRLVAAALIVGGCSSAPPTFGPSLNDITSATPTIRTAADAVVLVTMPGFLATGSFISPDGRLLTNNHVLGVGVCPVEGCYAQLTWKFQRGTPRSAPVTVFLVPRAVDVGLDMAVLQASSTPGGPPLATPSYLTIDARDPASLRGVHVTVVGHPEGSVKKWAAGEVVDADGNWLTTSAFTLPGDSGSPLLDDHGHIVGLMHRGPAGEDLIADDGLNAYSIGTVSSALIAAMSAPLPGSMRSISAPATDADVVKNKLLYLAAHTPTANVGGTTKKVLDSLGYACDAALAVTDYASPEDLSTALQPCFDAEDWIECRGDASTPTPSVPPTRARGKPLRGRVRVLAPLQRGARARRDELRRSGALGLDGRRPDRRRAASSRRRSPSRSPRSTSTSHRTSRPSASTRIAERRSSTSPATTPMSRTSRPTARTW